MGLTLAAGGAAADAAEVGLLQVATGPQVAAAILAARSGCDPALVAALVGVGTVLSLATVPGWWWVLGLGGGG